MCPGRSWRRIVKLESPPVIQTWIGFTFEPSSQKRLWNPESALEFLALFESSLPSREATFSTQYEIQELSLTQNPTVVRRERQLDKASARNRDGTHWLQLADDRLVYNRTRGEAVYLGFDSLRDEALDKLADYVNFFKPLGLRSTELHYVDLIEIPIPADKDFDLRDYFNLRVEIPPDFGSVWYFSTRIFLRTPINGDILEVKFESVPQNPDAETYRFRIDWHLECTKIESFDGDMVKRRLDQAHGCLTDYFKKSLTKRTWSLFQPSEEG